MTLIGDGTVVGLLLNVADQRKDRLIADNADLSSVRGHQCPGAMSVVLHHPEAWHLQTEICKCTLCRCGVDVSAIYQEQIRQRGKLFIPFQVSPEAARHRLIHAGVVVLNLQVPDPEFPIRGLVRSAFLKHRHCGDDPHTA